MILQRLVLDFRNDEVVPLSQRHAGYILSKLQKAPA